ncbi:hypothetical protein [Fructobacillus ficulneus]|uniref:Two-component system response regulator, LuxR family n=1 Tax=Fructobacillus ficulneus TaxID=157463 RepID=A0A0K8MFK5_9LACO|nr:hypothetical protein [Fructobacillus ficulneus]GAO99272.1 two-component system response regulator, LuxR family [Fructobacillus ficulneus]
MNKNNLSFNQIKVHKALKKVKKNWVVVSLSTVALFGGGLAMASTTAQPAFAADKVQTQGTSYNYGDLVKNGAVTTNSISWSAPDNAQLPTGTFDLLRGNGGNTSSVSFTINANSNLKKGDTIVIPLSTNIQNQPGAQTFLVSNFNTKVVENTTGAVISNSVSYNEASQTINMPLDGDDFDASRAHQITLNFQTNGGNIFPKSASNGSDLSISETVADQTHTYSWAPKPTEPDYKDNNNVNPMTDTVSDVNPGGVSVRTKVTNTDGLAFTQPVQLNNGQDYIQTIDITATGSNNGKVTPIYIQDGGYFWNYISVASAYGPATQAVGWTDQAANNQGGMSNATGKKITPFLSEETDSTTPG